MRLVVRMLGVISVSVLLGAQPSLANPRPTRTSMPDKDHDRPTRTPIDTTSRTRKPANPTRTPMVLSERTRKPTEAPTATRTPLANEPRPDHATKTARPTRTPLVKVENPTAVPRATRTPASTDIRTRKPGQETRPTRTALIIEEHEGKPTKTARATRTAPPDDVRTRKPEPQLRATRTPVPDEERETHATKSPRPTRTPVVKDGGEGTLRPTRTGIPTKTATPVSAFNESKVIASCRAIYKKDVTVILSVRNESGAPITEVTAGSLNVQRAPGTGFAIGSAPARFTRLPDGRTATFKWRGEFTTGSGTCGFSVSATAKGPNGESVEIPLTDCGTIVTGHAGESDLVPECFGGGAGEGGAAGCDGVEPPPSQSTGTGLPDLSIDQGVLASSMVIEERAFSGGSCAIAEQCVGGPGVRKLLRFSTRTPNLGTADLTLGDPRQGGPFQFSACHQHYHFNGYANYRLLGAGGQVVATGHKQAFCLLDLDPASPNAGEPKYHCLNQGISAGWADVYDRYLDCQWIDITGVGPGTYTLEVSINPTQYIKESNYGNNVARTTVTVP